MYVVCTKYNDEEISTRVLQITTYLLYALQGLTFEICTQVLEFYKIFYVRYHKSEMYNRNGTQKGN